MRYNHANQTPKILTTFCHGCETLRSKPARQRAKTAGGKSIISQIYAKKVKWHPIRSGFDYIHPQQNATRSIPGRSYILAPPGKTSDPKFDSPSLSTHSTIRISLCRYHWPKIQYLQSWIRSSITKISNHRLGHRLGQQLTPASTDNLYRTRHEITVSIRYHQISVRYHHSRNTHNDNPRSKSPILEQPLDYLSLQTSSFDKSSIWIFTHSVQTSPFNRPLMRVPLHGLKTSSFSRTIIWTFIHSLWSSSLNRTAEYYFNSWSLRNISSINLHSNIYS